MRAFARPAAVAACICALCLSQAAYGLTGQDTEPAAPAANAWLVEDLDAVWELILAGQFDESEARLRQLLPRAEQEFGADSIEVAAVLKNLFDTLQRAEALADPETWQIGDRCLQIREARFGPQAPEVGEIVVLLAQANGKAENWAEADDLYQRGIEIFEAAGDAYRYGLVRAIDGMGNSASSQGRHQDARDLSMRALVVAEESGLNALARAQVGLSIGYAEFNLGRYDEALPRFEYAAQEFAAALGADNPATAQAVFNTAAVAQAIGNYATALEQYLRVLAIEEARDPEHPDLAVTHGNIASAMHYSGMYVEARSHIAQALEILEISEQADSSVAARLWVELGTIARDTGDFDTAIRHHRKGLELLGGVHDGDHPAIADALHNLAVALQDSGREEEAFEIEDDVLEMRRRMLPEPHQSIAASFHNLGESHVRRSEYARAIERFEAARAMFADLGIRSADETGRNLLGLGNARMLSGDLETARAHFDEAYRLAYEVAGPEHPETGTALLYVADAALRAGEPRQALEAALESERIAASHLRLVARASPEREALTYAASRDTSRDLLVTLALDPPTADAVRSAWDRITRGRAAVLDEMALRAALGRAVEDPELSDLAMRSQRASQWLANLVVRGSLTTDEAYREELERARSGRDEAERALAAASQRFGQELEAPSIGLQEVLATLQDGDALVGYQRFERPGDGGGAEYAAFVARRDGEPLAIALGPAEAIESAVDDWQAEVRNQPEAPAAAADPQADRGVSLTSSAAGVAAGAYRDAAGSLTELIWAPVADALGQVDRVFVVPDGSLHLVSLVTLVDGEGSYLLESGPLFHYLSAERDLAMAGEPTGSGLLALGGADYDGPSPLDASLEPAQEGDAASSAKRSALFGAGRDARSCRLVGTSFEPLPGAAGEASDIAAIWETSSGAASEVTMLAPDAATEQALRRAAPGKAVVHLATHGFFFAGQCATQAAGTDETGVSGGGLPDRPVDPLLRSGLALAGANLRTADRQGDDGILTAQEVASLDLSGVQWVVLSACETGLGDIDAGEGVLGLRRAFRIAGAQTVVMSLWSVDDRATRDWMRALYEARLGANADSPESVRTAARSVVQQRRENGQSDHPFYWGAFVAAGAWR